MVAIKSSCFNRTDSPQKHLDPLQPTHVASIASLREPLIKVSIFSAPGGQNINLSSLTFICICMNIYIILHAVFSSLQLNKVVHPAVVMLGVTFSLDCSLIWRTITGTYRDWTTGGNQENCQAREGGFQVPDKGAPCLLWQRDL